MQNAPLKIGLTGGIGCGKSTVAGLFADLGVPTFSADAIGHELSGIGQPGYLEIVEQFGSGILQENRELDRAALGDLVFNDSLLKSRLEKILHPMIMQAMHQRAEACAAPYCILDIPLLINTAEVDRIDRVLVVYCELETRISRIRERNQWREEKIARVMDNQLSDQALLEAADDIIENNSDVASLRAQVSALHDRYLALADRS